VALIFRLNPSIPPISISPRSSPNESFLTSIDFITISLKNLENLTPETHFFDFLLIKRGNHINDRHSGQIAFPGGKCEGLETDFLAVKREVLEEVGLNLDDRNQYLPLGKIPLNTWAYYHEPEKSTYISMFVFFEISQSQTMNFNEEVQKAFWQPFMGFFHKGNLKKEIDFSIGQNHYFKNKRLFEFFQRNCFRDFEARIYRVFILENGEKIYGLSFNILMYIIGLLRKEALNDVKELRGEIREIDNLLKNCFEIKFLIKRKWLGGHSKSKGFLIWWIFYLNRIRQFKVK